MIHLTKLKALVFLLLVLQFSSCKKTEDIDPADATSKEVDEWIHEQMKTYYLWTDQMPLLTATNTALAPDDYFESILVKPGELDRFSWIQESSEELTNSLNGKNTALGIRTAPFYSNTAKTKVTLAIAYALKGSPAEKAGIKRGDFITQVDGKDLTPENYGTALSAETMTVTLGEYSGGEVINTTKTVTMTKAELQTDPIQYSTVIEKGNKKIGYLVYLQFLTQYDDKLRQTFADFKAKGVNELVLDLRYNPGGYISSSDILSSLIVKNLNPNLLMNKQEWNTTMTKAYVDKYGPEVFETKFRNEANNLGTLNRVYILTSSGTASASELVINNLKPFMDVILIGGNTYGKNVGSITISDSKKRWKWGMQPIVLKTVNAKGESNYGTKDGFTPDFKVSDNVIPFKPFGDVNETFLKVAVEQITGQPVVASANARKVADKQVQLLSNSFPLDNPRADRKEMWVDKLPGQ
ncbi:peptidase S41 [Emticicia sp. CRIBPO]|uniref:S41 family peptidase n=1 Tax=Emticicia sp. CRIBPO TaxID=2683258 RepID=UPI0014129A01|nr:S41 family peptidase [Emticicia sp. CRIBPO]NBA88215.1 peptidase S41 [Emticicia sp. CRIBPO]